MRMSFLMHCLQLCVDKLEKGQEETAHAVEAGTDNMERL